MKPTKGRTVNFVGSDGEIYPAIVTKVNGDDSISVVSFGESSFYFSKDVPYRESTDVAVYPRHSWHWPPRQ